MVGIGVNQELHLTASHCKGNFVVCGGFMTISLSRDSNGVKLTPLRGFSLVQCHWRADRHKPQHMSGVGPWFLHSQSTQTADARFCGLQDFKLSRDKQLCGSPVISYRPPYPATCYEIRGLQTRHYTAVGGGAIFTRYYLFIQLK